MLNIERVKTEKLGLFNFKAMNGKYLLTNEAGDFIFLKKKDFVSLIEGKLDKQSRVYSDLAKKDMIHTSSLRAGLEQIEHYRNRNSFLWRGPTLHIIVVTLRCDHKCVYCQSSSRPIAAREFDMHRDTAKRIVDVLLESPNKHLTVEFQGGEPLLNFEAIRYIVMKTTEKSKKLNKRLNFSLVSNFTYMNDEVMKFLIEYNVHICTSLDGPERIHNAQRIWAKGNSYKNTVFWLKKIKRFYHQRRRSGHFSFSEPGALPTITRRSLKHHKQIVDEYYNLGLSNIHLRPVMAIGIGRKRWDEITFSAEEFLKFYKKALDYIICLNLKGRRIFFERMAKYLLMRILAFKEPNYVDLRSPCGAGITQLVYDFNGDVYTCDEGRMVAQMGDSSFYLGNVRDNGLDSLVSKETVKAMCIASCLDVLPACNQCVYKPYCGVCPLYNYLEEANIFRNNAERCSIYKGILDYLFEKMQDKMVTKEVFSKWIKLS